MLDDRLSDFLSRGFKHYTEIRAQNNAQRSLVFLNGTMTSNDSSSSGGLSVRVHKNGSYGFASTPQYTKEGIEAALKAATENCLFLHDKERLPLPKLPATPPVREDLRYTRDDALPQKTLIDYVKALDSYISSKYPNLLARRVVANCLDMEKLLITSDGAYSHSLIPRSFIHVSLAVSDAEGAPVEIYEPFGGYGRFYDRFNAPEELYDKVDALYANLMQKREGVYPRPGIQNVILHADLAGILAHEAVGHTVEADFVQSGSVAGKYLNQPVASELVTLVDFANTAFGKPCPQPIYVDDEGTPARDALLIKDGILCGYMHNKESALKFGAEPTGNARAFAFSDEPLIRMRNTCILPGKDKLDDMISAIDDGYFFIKTGNGQADATGEFMFSVNFGYEIKKGKLGKALKDSTISGVAFDVLKTVDMISDDLSWDCSGMCGKKQPMPVGMGGPAIKCRLNVGGR